MSFIDTIPADLRQQVSASLHAKLLRVYHEADDEQEKSDAATLIAFLREDAKPDGYSDLTLERDDLGSFSVDSSHQDYVGPLDSPPVA